MGSKDKQKMRSVFAVVSLTCFLLLSGCVKPIHREVLATADYGPPPPEDYKRLVKIDMQKVLVDAVDPIYVFDPPMKGYTIRQRRLSTMQMYGWLICGTVNGKPSLSGYAGYTGPLPFFVMFKNGKIVEKMIGQKVEDDYGVNRFNAAIDQVCRSAKRPKKLD